MSVCTSCGHETREGAKFCDACGAVLAAAAPAREQRKTVTVLFCDVTGSTALGERLDPEALRTLLARYFEHMSAIIGSHGGTVEKFIGDAVMAVFGVPQLHEDDALRAVRAAIEMRDALPGLGVEGRIGVATGEVVTGTKERLATGDTVNVAARLEQAAQPGEVLIGAETLALVRTAVEVEPVEPLSLKGKSRPVPAFRLLAVTGELQRSDGATMVGRDDELQGLRRAWERSGAERTTQLFTIFGTAGMGKSRLAAEFLGSVDARVVRGRCISYGAGITYWPLVEILKQLATTPPDATAAQIIATLLGETPAPITADEIVWAFRKTLEHAAEEQPLVVVFDDLHWAEPALLDLVEHVAVSCRDTPLLLLCMARPELLDRRPGWAGGLLNATSVLLEPLTAADTDALIELLLAGNELSAGLRSRIREAAEGNPLFVEEMLAMVRAAPGGEVVVPPTIQALLAARLDQLDPTERSVLERGSVEGKVFHRGSVEALAPGEPQVPTQLLALVRKELLRPERARLVGEDAFRFRHLLIRDAAYDGLPKSVRAELHRRFATWLIEHDADLVELDEIVGYHLEQAHRYGAELGQPDDPALAAEAFRRLAAAGRRALLRHDLGAALNLLDRAAALVAPDELDLALELDRIDTHFFSGAAGRAVELADELAEQGRARGDRSVELCALIEGGIVRLHTEPEGVTAALDVLLAEALPRFEAEADELALYTASVGVCRVAHMRAQMDAMLGGAERAVALARRLDSPHREKRLAPLVGSGRVSGTTPVRDVLAWLDAGELEGPVRHPALRMSRATSLAMLGRFDEARHIIAVLVVALRDQGATIGVALTGGITAEIERLAGDWEAAAAAALGSCRLYREAGERGWLSTTACLAAGALVHLDRLDEAEALLQEAVALGASEDILTQMLARQIEARILARRGDPAEAERLAHEAVTLAETTDMLDAQGNALADLAETLALIGKREQAVEALRQAAERFERKGNIVSLGRIRGRLAEIEAAAG